MHAMCVCLCAHVWSMRVLPHTCASPCPALGSAPGGRAPWPAARARWSLPVPLLFRRVLGFTWAHSAVIWWSSAHLQWGDPIMGGRNKTPLSSPERVGHRRNNVDAPWAAAPHGPRRRALSLALSSARSPGSKDCPVGADLSGPVPCGGQEAPCHTPAGQQLEYESHCVWVCRYVRVHVCV